MKLTARSVSCLPGRRTDGNTGARRRRIAAAGKEAGGNVRGNEDLSRLTALADDLELRLPTVAPDDLAPGQADEWRGQVDRGAQFEYRFNRRYDLPAMIPRLGWVAAPRCADGRIASSNWRRIMGNQEGYCISMFQNTGAGVCSIPTRFLRISER